MTGTAGDLPLGADVARQLEQLIFEGALTPGEKLRQERIAQTLGVSRTPIREALLILQSRGLVTIVPNQGARVRRVTRRDCAETYLVRAELEGLAAGLAAERVTRAELKRLSDCARELRRCDRVLLKAPSAANYDRSLTVREARRRWIDANDRFHDTLVTASRCDRLADTLKQLLSSLPRTITWLAIEQNISVLERYHNEHQEIIEALTSRDAARAREVAHRHVMRARDLMLTWLDTAQDGIAY